MTTLITQQLAALQAKIRAVREAIAGQAGGIVSINELALTCTPEEAQAYLGSLQAQADALDNLLSG